MTLSRRNRPGLTTISLSWRQAARGETGDTAAHPVATARQENSRTTFTRTFKTMADPNSCGSHRSTHNTNSSSSIRETMTSSLGSRSRAPTRLRGSSSSMTEAAVEKKRLLSFSTRPSITSSKYTSLRVSVKRRLARSISHTYNRNKTSRCWPRQPVSTCLTISTCHRNFAPRSTKCRPWSTSYSSNLWHREPQEPRHPSSQNWRRRARKRLSFQGRLRPQQK